MLLHNNKFMWLTVVEGPAKPAQHSNVTLRVLGGAQQRCLCFQGAGREQSASLDLQGAGFGVDTLPWCWALPQASHTCRMWFLIEQSCLPSQDRGVSSLEHLSLPLSAAQTFARGACEENTFSPTGRSGVATAAAKKPFCCPGRAGQGSRERAQLTHTSFTPWAAAELNPASSGLITPVLIWNFPLRREEKYHVCFPVYVGRIKWNDETENYFLFPEQYFLFVCFFKKPTTPLQFHPSGLFRKIMWQNKNYLSEHQAHTLVKTGKHCSWCI